MSPYKSAVLNLYKTLLYMGRDYPLGYEFFRRKCHEAFAKHRTEVDEARIRHLIKYGKFMVKELEALYRLKKYRAMKKRYYTDDGDDLYREFAKKIGDVPER